MVAAQLRRQIVTGELKEGDALPPESALMAQFGVSRPTLREAFRILESEQIIQIRRGARGGAHVLVPDAAAAGRYAGTLLQYRGATLADLHQARGALESTAVGALARKRSAADLRRLERALVEGEDLVGDPIAFAEKHDLQFHRLLVELAGNQTMIVLVDMVFSIIERHNQSFINAHRDDGSAEPSVKATQKAHAKIVDLIRAKDADKAIAFWRRHLDQVSEYMISDPAETVLDVLS
ncbi:FadR family transcriptional regulator [Amycolatopsis acidiphila]|uniref:FadR family transcriptional regulator n=2 Tax=Amycolatopsis acidiphila TaxID=715473 RepID=A0A557ZZM3_9PSEU|nr:FadR family transcriptional regulator [Amycolatopsis acidiphila]